MAVTLVLVPLAGCSSVPEYLNPVEWYEGATSTVSGWFDEEEAAAKDSASSYPTLTSSGAGSSTTTAGQRQAIKNGLGSDKANARYSSEGSNLWPKRQASAPRAAIASAPSTPSAPAPAPAAPTVTSQTSSIPAPSTSSSSSQAVASSDGQVTMDASTSQESETSSSSSPMMSEQPSGQGSVIIDEEALAAIAEPQQPAGPQYLAATIGFRHASANLSGEDLAVIRQIADGLIESNGSAQVVGHASSRTAEMPVDKHDLANFTISLKRAEAVANALIDAGVPAERVALLAMSDTQPLYFESMPSGEAGNRRAEILVSF